MWQNCNSVIPQAPGVSRNQYRTVALAREFGLLANAFQSKLLVARQKRYLSAVRRSFSQCRSFGLAPDKSRFGGKGWLASSVLGVESREICWAPLMVTPTLLNAVL